MDINVASVVLGLLLLIPLWIMFKAQREDGFKWSQMLRDSEGKESAVRFGIPVSLAVSSYVVMFMALHAKDWTPNDVIQGLTLYLAVWSSTLIVSKVVDKWDGRLPFAKIPPAPGSQ